MQRRSVLKLTVIEPALVNLMRVRLAAQTDECLQETFGISWNLWKKLKAGQPIRQSTALRLEGRLAALAAEKSDLQCSRNTQPS